MAEFLITIGAVASISQIVGYLAKTAISVQGFREAVANAPLELEQIAKTMDMLRTILEDLRKVFPVSHDDDILPRDLRILLHSTAQDLHHQMARVRSECRVIGHEDLSSTRKKVLYVIKDRKILKDMFKRLAVFDRAFFNLLQYLNAYVKNCRWLDLL
jgi:predicted nucleotidyltransferase